MLRALARIGAIALALSSTTAPAATPLDDLVKPEAGNGACFVRIYDEAHLRRHPKQRITAIAALLQYEPIGGGVPGVALGLGLSISQSGDPHSWFAQGGCDWDAHANWDVQGRLLMPLSRRRRAPTA